MSTPPPIRNHVARHRQARGWSAVALAEAAGISRQALSAIEAGRTTPSTAIALRLARVLDQPVEALFSLEDTPVPGLAPGLPPGTRVALGRVAGRWVAHRLDPRDTAPADGLVTASGAVEAIEDLQQLDEVALVAGCAPFLGALAGHRGAAGSGGGRWLLRTSRAALRALSSGRAHLAGLHLAAADDPGAHERLVRDALPGEAVDLVEVVAWREGLALAPANPRGLRTVADLAAPGLRVARRPPGAGAAAVLARACRGVGLDRDTLTGPAVASHVDAALAVAHGAADAAVVVEPVAAAFGLAFLPLSEERFELALRRRDRDHPGVRRLLDRLNDARFAREVRAMGAYDTSTMGTLRPLVAA